MYDMTIRHPDEMDKFAEQIDKYADNIKATCESLNNDLLSSKAYLRDDMSKTAIRNLQKLCEELQSGLPAIKKVSEQLVAAAKPLHKAPDLF